MSDAVQPSEYRRRLRCNDKVDETFINVRPLQSTGSSGHAVHGRVSKDWIHFVVSGTGEEDGHYVQVGTVNDKPKFKQMNGASIMYFSGFWKINFEDDVNEGLYVCWGLQSADDLPPVGEWIQLGRLKAVTPALRKFQVSEGEIVEVLSVFGPTYFPIQRCSKSRMQLMEAASTMEAGLVKKEYLELDVCCCGTCRDFQKRELAASAPDDKEVKALLALLGTGGESMPSSWGAYVFESGFAHATAIITTWLLFAVAVQRGPTHMALLLSAIVAYLAVDLGSTLYHLILDAGLLSSVQPTASYPFFSGPQTVTDYHHAAPLNYVLFDRWQLLASSYIVVFPFTCLNILLWVCLSYCKASSWIDAFMASYTAAFQILGFTAGFTHAAAHRRNHGLHLPTWVRVLQDLQIILPPEKHSLHHRSNFDMNYSLFSGVTHPISNASINLARSWALLPPTAESQLT